MENEGKDKKRNIIEEIEIAGDQLVSRVKELIREGNVRRLIIRKSGGDVLLEIPLTAGLAVGGVTTIFAPILVALGAMAGLIANFKVEVVRRPKGFIEEDTGKEEENDVEGQVRSSITVSPQQMVLGEVPSGKTVSKKLIVRGRQPFKITSVECDDDCFTFKTDDESKKLHLVTVKFLSLKKLGKVEHDIRIHTDLGETVVTLSAFATVVAAAE